MKTKLGLLLFWGVLAIAFDSISEEVRFDGTLVEDACEVSPDDENITLDFGTVVDKSLYLHTRTRSEPFTIRLINCDLVLGKEVQVTFFGQESIELPGLLALDEGSQAKGIAIGLENSEGEAVKFNETKAHTQDLHHDNVNAINLRAYIQAEPSALQGQNVVLGPFAAITTFMLEYQ